ncbi:MAG: alpha/beta hydrolase [Pseudomonadales bacterium]|nr:alpha/beta hydrolase [Pseudomonadales bacterium]
MDTKQVQLGNGTTLAYLERPGGDIPLVLLHGITNNAASYEPVLAGIDAGCHVYALDFRGHGNSSRPSARYDTAAYADDVIHFISEVVCKPVLLGGHSLGGLVTVQTAVTAPERIRAIFLEDPPLYFVGSMDPIYEALFNGVVVMATTLQDGSRSAEEWFQVMAKAPDPYNGKPGLEVMGEARIRRRLDSIGRMDPRAMQDGLDGALKWDTDAVLARIKCPVTMITGNRALGAVISEEETRRVQSIVNDCKVTNVPDVGHMINDLRPAEWQAAINGWIRGQVG